MLRNYNSQFCQNDSAVYERHETIFKYKSELETIVETVKTFNWNIEMGLDNAQQATTEETEL